MLPTIDCRGNDFILVMPGSNRSLIVPANANGVAYLRKIISESKQGFAVQPKGYLRSFPTQHIVNRWIKQDRARKAEAAKETAKLANTTLGLDLSKVEFTI